ncbi:hypothetical protein [Sorangium sp. So ce513]|uniref:hypothetical protein n=1 Tax=Sorangium sp. So ce513 TaxID=3133315 RepID=UPI003F5E3547
MWFLQDAARVYTTAIEENNGGAGLRRSAARAASEAGLPISTAVDRLLGMEI